MIIRCALPPEANLPERINDMTERLRITRMTGTLPTEHTLGAGLDGEEA